MKKIILFTSAVLSTMVFADDISITQGRAITDIDNLYACVIPIARAGWGMLLIV